MHEATMKTEKKVLFSIIKQHNIDTCGRSFVQILVYSNMVGTL